MVVAAYGLILPQWVLDAPRLGCLNIHASCCRAGAARRRSIARSRPAMRETGVTIMQMDAGLDTGDMLLREALAIGDDTHRPPARPAGRPRRPADRARRCSQAEAGTLTPMPQPAEGVTYAHKVEKDEAPDRLALAGGTIARAHPRLRSVPGRQQRARRRDDQALGCATRPPACRSRAPGTVLAAAPAGIAVATGDGIVRVTELQRAGGKRLPAADFLRGFRRRARAGASRLSLMFCRPRSGASRQFREGARDMAPVAARHRRLGPDDRRGHGQVGHERLRSRCAMTLLVYAGSSQLAAIPLLFAGAPAWVILATGFCVNLRFVVFSLHLRPYLMHMPRWRRMTQRLPDGRHELRACSRASYPTPADAPEGQRRRRRPISPAATS